jgi:hypothetical protein
MDNIDTQKKIENEIRDLCDHLVNSAVRVNHLAKYIHENPSNQDVHLLYGQYIEGMEYWLQAVRKRALSIHKNPYYGY